MEQYANLAQTTLAAPLAKGATTLTVVSAAKFPTRGTFRLIVDAELMLVTAVEGTTFTVERAIEGTTAVEHGAGAALTSILTAGSIGAKPTASPTGGIPGWAAKTAYNVNDLVQQSGIVYICSEAHTSGEAFTGAQWEILAGTGAEFSCPPPTGVAATDTANVEATLKAAGEVAGLARIDQPGTYQINKELIQPFNVSIYIGPTTNLKGSAPVTGECLLSDSKTEKTISQSIVGGGTLNSNNVFKHALWPRYFGHQLVLGVKPKNSLEDDCILGDNTATGPSQEPVLTADFLIQRSTGTTPVGHACLWAQNASDGRMPGTVMTGQETGFRIDKGGWRGFGVHPTGAEYPMQVCIEDNVGCEFMGLNLDTPTPKEHAGATGEAASSTITDAAILANHEGRPVTGTNIPAGSAVGAVTPGVSFTLKNAETGASVKPTGAVSGITLVGVGYLISANGFSVSGQVYVSPKYGVDNGCVGVMVATNVSVGKGVVNGFQGNGGSAEFRVTKALAGKLSAISWSNLVERNCVEKVFPSTQFQGAALEAASPSSPGLLAVTQYAPNAQVTKTTESKALVDVDAVNLAVTFTFPPSGKVLVRLSAEVTNNTSGSKVHWGLREGETQRGNAGCASPSNTAGVRALALMVEGTPGATVILKWAWAVSANKGEMLIMNTSPEWTNSAAPATMEVWAA